jgi:hypothetical protein
MHALVMPLVLSQMKARENQTIYKPPSHKINMYIRGTIIDLS